MCNGSLVFSGNYQEVHITGLMTTVGIIFYFRFGKSHRSAYMQNKHMFPFLEIEMPPNVTS